MWCAAYVYGIAAVSVPLHWTGVLCIHNRWTLIITLILSFIPSFILLHFTHMHATFLVPLNIFTVISLSLQCWYCCVVYSSMDHMLSSLPLSPMIWCSTQCYGKQYSTCNLSSQGMHKVLKENQKAKATVGGIIDAAGSLGTHSQFLNLLISSLTLIT